MRELIPIIVIVFLVLSGCNRNSTMSSKFYKEGDEVRILKSELKDKIKGGWAGQVIGCTYGGPTEFRFNGTIIDDRIPIFWDENMILWNYTNRPGLYDDVYMDLTFVEVFDKHGLDAGDSLHALAFANAGYQLWHANQAARYNILNGTMPPASGNWKRNPHADDIDFQIEADFAGLMSPGMVNAASEICDRIGHIMNYGDGYYGGVYVAAMYSLAFVYNDIKQVVCEALKTIPEQSEFYQCIADVIHWHNLYPDDWKQTWFEAQKKWSFDRGCPDGVFRAFDIDAKINAAYIVIGLLYGDEDFGKTIDISTRCGLDSDCNPASAAGILGALIGYTGIPAFWRQGLDKVEDVNFKYTNMSLNKVYKISMQQASEMIKRNNGKESSDFMTIKYQTPKPVQLEKSFEGLFPTERRELGIVLDNRAEQSFEFRGNGFVLLGRASKENQLPDTTLIVNVFINNELMESVKMPTNYLQRRLEIAWKYDLPESNYTLRLAPVEIPQGYRIQVVEAILYSAIDPGLVNY